MNNEKKFLKPEADIVEFCNDDIILTSNPLEDQNLEGMIEL